MTDPTGLSFLSYRRTRPDDARLLMEHQHDLGIPTWQDIADLGQGHTDAQLRAALADPMIANAVAYLTPDVKDSATITRTELPGILQRIDAKDDFFLVPVAAGGLDYAGVAATVGTYVGVHDIGQWNVTKIDSNPLNETDAHVIARKVLKHRLSHIHAAAAPHSPLRVELHTRGAPAHRAGSALTLDWTHRFAGRQASNDSWNSFLLPALNDIGNALSRFAPGRAVQFGGQCALPAATALGVTFLATRGISASWQQTSPKREPQDWSLSSPRVSSGLRADFSSADVAADDLALLISIASNVEPAFAASRLSLPKFRAIVHIKPASGYPYDLTSAGQASDVAAIVVEALRQARDQFQARGTVHLFMAGPVGVAFLLGQSLNTAGPVQTYEHLQSDAVGRYVQAILLQPGT